MSTVVFPDPARVSLRRIALPVEQGGWSLAGEPVVLGMLAVPSIGGFLVGIAAIAAFLARQPVKIVVADVYWGRLVQRSSVAAVVAIVYLTTAAAALIVAVRMSGTDLLLPLLFAFPFAAVQIAYDGANESRQALPEVCGSIGIAGSVAMIATAGGAGELAVVLWPSRVVPKCRGSHVCPCAPAAREKAADARDHCERNGAARVAPPRPRGGGRSGPDRHGCMGGRRGDGAAAVPNLGGTLEPAALRDPAAARGRRNHLRGDLRGADRGFIRRGQPVTQVTSSCDCRHRSFSSGFVSWQQEAQPAVLAPNGRRWE